MIMKLALAVAAGLLTWVGIPDSTEALDDAQIAHIAYTADAIDAEAGKLALAKSSNMAVRSFAEEMVRDHTAVNDQALALVAKLGVVPRRIPRASRCPKPRTKS